MYAVLDVETTGLNPGWKHRIAEVAVVLVDKDGRVQYEWCSLVNPERDLGPQHLHGIRAADARRAPTFDKLAWQITELISGRVVVAHNLAFDAMFLRYEFDRLGVSVPLRADAGLCTMRLADRYLPTSGRSLRDCCAAAGVPLNGWHSALSDARAAAGLLATYLAKDPEPPFMTALVAAAEQERWPALTRSVAAPVTRSSEAGTTGHFLSRLVDQLPRVPQPPEADTYLSVLDRALIDRHISGSEADELVDLAGHFGLDRAAVTDLHRAYLRALARNALSDGVVTAEERHDLETVASLLGLGRDAVEQALNVTGVATSVPTFRLRRHDAVVLTGQMTEPREAWEERARAAGLDVKANVTKKTRLVVAADPDSLSGKARKARDYGIPIVTEAGFGRLLTDLHQASGQQEDFA